MWLPRPRVPVRNIGVPSSARVARIDHPWSSTVHTNNQRAGQKHWRAKFGTRGTDWSPPDQAPFTRTTNAAIHWHVWQQPEQVHVSAMIAEDNGMDNTSETMEFHTWWRILFLPFSKTSTKERWNAAAMHTLRTCWFCSKTCSSNMGSISMKKMEERRLRVACRGNYYCLDRLSRCRELF